MRQRIILILLLSALVACAAPHDGDGGIGGTGAPPTQESAV